MKLILTFMLIILSSSALIAGTFMDFKYKVFNYKCGNQDRSCAVVCKKCGDEDWCAIFNNCPSDVVPSDPCDFTGSYVSSVSSSYFDVFSESASLNGSYGCAPCGGAKSSSSQIKQFNLLRYYASRRGHRVWDMGLGQASNIDMRLTLSEETDGSLTIYQEIPQAEFAPMYLDGRRGDTRDGIFHGSQQNASVEMHLLNDQDQVVLNYSDASKIRFIDFKFTTYEYEVIPVSTTEYAGRLRSIKDLNGYGLTVTYKNDIPFTVQQLIDNPTDPNYDPALQWRRNTVTDSTGRVFTFNYETTDRGGEYVISSVQLPNGSSVYYEYTDTYLSKVTYPDNSFSTYFYDVDGDGDTVLHANETSGKVKEIYMSSNAALISSHSGQILYNQNSMGVGTVRVNGEITYAYFQGPTGNYAKVYTGEGQMKFRHIDRTVKFYENFSFTEDTNGQVTYDTITGNFEDEYLNRNYTGPYGVEYPNSIQDVQGNNYSVDYDSLNRIVFKSYSDNTFEAWSYNNLNQPTRYRDRLGRVTLTSYDSRGNLLTKQVGLWDSYTGNASSYNHKYWTTGNLAQIAGASASQSSNGNAWKAIDGNTNGQFNMYSVTDTQNELQPWWKVQLVRSSLVNQVKIYNRKEVPERLADFTVSLYDGATLVHQETIIDPVASEGIVTIIPPANTYADSVQVQLNGTNVLSLAEVEVFGSDSVVDAQAPTSDNASTAYAIYVNEYYPAGTNQYLLKYQYDAMDNVGSLDVNDYNAVLTYAAANNDQRKEFIYYPDNLLKYIKEPDDAGSGYHNKNYMVYDTYKRLSSITDAVGRITTFNYDDRDRLTKTTFQDGSTELVIYGTTELDTGMNIVNNEADLVVKRKDRNGNVTKYDYDNAGRLVETIVAHSQMDVDGTHLGNNDATLQSLTSITYFDGQNVAETRTVNGDLTVYTYDYRNRIKDTIRYADATSALITTNTYHKNKLLKTTDPYGRSTYFNYRSSDSAMIRTVQETVPGGTNLANEWFSAVNNLQRITLTTNADYLITDYDLDVEGQTIGMTDPKGIKQKTDYDSRGRIVLSISDFGGIDQTTQTFYDANSNVVEVRNPRSFSTIETVLDIVSMSYNRRNMIASRTVALGSTTDEATEYFTYYLDGRPATHEDFRGKITTQIWKQCCGRLGVVASPSYLDKAGSLRRSAKIMEYDYFGNLTHSAVLDWDAGAALPPCCYPDPLDSATEQETTVRMDARHRPVAQTVWNEALGEVLPNSVPIAGDSGVTKEGFTTKMTYYDEAALANGSAAHDELEPLLTELNNDGITFNGNANGSAVITINPVGEVSVAIMDGVGRTVASGMYDKYDWALGTYTLVTWQTVKHDVIDSIATNNLLETKTISALGYENKVWTDGAGRRIKTKDALGKENNFEYDANSNLVKFRDANGVGQNCVFDNLNRDTECTDTFGDKTKRTYDLNNNLTVTEDAKENTTVCNYDDRNRKVDCTDRNSGTTSYSYDDNSNVLTITDALSKVTTYVYDDRNLQLEVIYADNGSVTCFYDALGRKAKCIDQLTDSVTYNYDLAGRLTSREYKLNDSSSESTDNFSYDDASRILTASKGRYNNTVTFTYDGIGRKYSEAVTVNSNTYTITHDDLTTTEKDGYDVDNRVLFCTYPSGTKVSKSWTNRNQLDTVKWGADDIIDFGYDDGMREVTRTFGNGLVSTKTYREDPNDSSVKDNMLAKISVANNADLSFDYTYDANKNVTAETSTGTVMNFYDWTTVKDANDNGFDAIDRVTYWKRSNTANPDYQSWNLDKIGNWDNTTGTLGTAFNETRTHNNVHELEYIGATQLTYDDKGNLTGDFNGNTLVWDIDNHLKSFNTITFKYDALGRRLEKINGSNSTLYICEGQRVIEEHENSGSGYSLARSYLYGSYVDDLVAKVESGSTLFYHSDRQFNVRGLTDEATTPAIKELYAYSVYGQQTILDSSGSTIGASAFSNSYGYTGRYLDSETGLWYFRARYFDAEMGRFISRDPLGYVDGMSLYNGYFAQQFGMDPSGNQQFAKDKDGDGFSEIEEGLAGTSDGDPNDYPVDKPVKIPPNSDNQRKEYNDKNKPTEACNINGKQITCEFDGKHFSCSTGFKVQAVSGIPKVGVSSQRVNGDLYVTETRTFDYSRTNQKVRGEGPTPEGTYWISSCKTNNCNNAKRHKYLQGSWGEYSWHMHPEPGFSLRDNKGVDRNNMFIHGGNIPNSRGCVDLMSNIKTFHDQVVNKTSNKDCCYIQIKIKYTAKQQTMVNKTVYPIFGKPASSGWMWE